MKCNMVDFDKSNRSSSWHKLSFQFRGFSLYLHFGFTSTLALNGEAFKKISNLLNLIANLLTLYIVDFNKASVTRTQQNIELFEFCLNVFTEFSENMCQYITIKGLKPATQPPLVLLILWTSKEKIDRYISRGWQCFKSRKIRSGGIWFGHPCYQFNLCAVDCSLNLNPILDW